MQVIEKKQYTAIQLKDEEKRKLAKELELAGEKFNAVAQQNERLKLARVDTAKEISTRKEAHDRELNCKNVDLEKLSSQVEALTFKLETLQNQSDTAISSHEVKVQTLMLELQKYKEQSVDNEKIKEKLEVSLQEYSSQVDSLRVDLSQMRKQSIGDKEIMQEIEANLKESSSELKEERKLTQELKSSLQAKSMECDTKGKELKTSLEMVKQTELKLSNKRRLKQDLESSLQLKSVDCQRQVIEVKALESELKQNERLRQKLETSLQVKSSQCENKANALKRLELELKQSESLRKELETSLQVKTANYDNKVNDNKESLQNKCQIIETLEAQLNVLKQNCDEEVDQWSNKLKECNDKLTQINCKLETSVSRQSSLTKENKQFIVKLQAEERENATLEQERSLCAARLDKKTKDEKALRREVVKKKQTIALLQSKEKHLEEHVKSLEEQINKLVSEYESKSQVDNQVACE